MHARVEMRSEQRLALLPEVLQSLQILQLAAHELDALIRAEVENNVALALDERRPPRKAERAATGASGAVDRLPAPAAGLHEFLRAQLAWLDCAEGETAAVLAVAEHLDPSGLLTVPIADLRAALPGVDVDGAVALLRTLEPRGIAQPTAAAAMLAQVDLEDVDFVPLASLLEGHIGALAEQRWPQVARALDIDTDRLAHLLERLERLTPRPAEAFVVARAEPVLPELAVAMVGDDVEVRFLDGGLPPLRVDPRYASLAEAGDPELRAYLRPKLLAARDLIRAVDLRRHTLLAVTTAVMRRQVRFLRHGMRYLLPLRMQDIADAVGVHASTVSRACAGKWLTTPQGCHALRAFFDAGGGEDGGGGLGQKAVQARIAELIAAEAPDCPLSDDAISALLASDGVQVARRTVAKHRAELGLPTRDQRRRRRR